jgi:hypothetical protein
MRFRQWSTLDQHSTSIDDFPGCHTSTSPSTWVFLALLPLAKASFIYPFFLVRAYRASALHVHTPWNSNRLRLCDFNVDADLAASWEALFVFDALIFALTVRKTYTTCQSTGIGAGTLDLPIHELILRDGASSSRFPSLPSFLKITQHQSNTIF